MIEPFGWRFCWFVSLFNLFFFSQAQSICEKVFIISLLLQLSSTLHSTIQFTVLLDFFDIKWLSEKYYVWSSCVHHWFCSILEIQKRPRSIDSGSVVKAGHACSLGRTASPSNAISGLHHLVYQPSLSVCETLHWSNDLFSKHGASACLCFSAVCLQARTHSQSVQLTHTYMN